MRIVQILPYAMARPGGVQSHVRDLSHWLRGEGHEVRIVAPPTPDGICAYGTECCGKSRMVSMFGTRFEVSYALRAERRRLIADLRDWGADLVHLPTPWTPFVAWQVWRELRLPTVTTFHATLPAADVSGLAARVLRIAARHFLSHSRIVVVPSPTPLPHLGAAARDARVEVVPPSVDLAPWRQARKTEQNQGLDIVFLGRFEARKGLDVLLAAWPQIASALPDARLTIAGGGELRPLVEHALVLPHGERIRLVDRPDDITARTLVGGADIFAAPAPYGESFGLVLVEAMAAGALPVAAANDGYASVMNGEGAELLVPPGDAGALAQRIVSLAGDRPARERLTVWADARAQGADIRGTGPVFTRLYREALGLS